MSAGRDDRQNTETPGKRAEDDSLLSKIMGLLGAVDNLENVEEPTAAELAALEDVQEPTAAELAALEDVQEPTAAELAALEEEPTAAELAALEAEDDPFVLPVLPDLSAALHAPLPLMNTREEPELVSLEGLGDVGGIKAVAEDALEEGNLQDAVLNYADFDLDDDEIEDEGYDLDDDDIDHYQDLYGDDGDITPSFREGEVDDEDESGIAFYDDLR